MARQHLLLLVLMASILHLGSCRNNSTVDAATVTAYDVLEQNKLPRGLLPLGVKSYVLHEGTMQVTLPGECNFFVTIAGDQYKVRYGSTVGGVIQSGSVTQVFGVRMQGPFKLWLGFTQADRVGDKLKILLGDTYTQSFPISTFAKSPKCN